MFVHAVYFWLRDRLSDPERAQFVAGLHALRGIETVREGYIGVPAATNRAVIERGYSHALVLVFADQAA
ncbi:MAG: Dabb family protein, partial [Candidatus Eremiobacteraeota bacterium]|nr:Dabb family protein [Candidatus Eremiobacteraeota bacterium]